MSAPARRRLYGLFPYLTLFEPIELLGIPLRHEARETAEPPFDEILPIFRDANGEPVPSATRFVLEAGAGDESAAARQVQDLVALLGYLVLDPEHPASSPAAENLAVWLLEPADGDGQYLATPNFSRYLPMDVHRQAVYPSAPDMTLAQDRINPGAPGLALTTDPAWTSPESAPHRARLLLAMYWYGRTFTTNPQEDDRTKIVHLATAFEVLLRIGIDRGKRTSLQGELQKLLGDEPLLDEWAGQFYDTRSDIVHRGWTADLLFRHPQATRAHASLVQSGQRILRVATEAEVRRRAGGDLARELPGLFYRRYVQTDLEPNEARLVRLRATRKLRGRAGRDFLNLVGELRLTDISGSLDDLAAVGRRLLTHFVERCVPGTHPPAALLQALDAPVEAAALVEAYRGVAVALRDGSAAPWPVSHRDDLQRWRIERAVRHFAAYVQTVAPTMDGSGRAPEHSGVADRA